MTSDRDFRERREDIDWTIGKINVVFQKHSDLASCYDRELSQ